MIDAIAREHRKGRRLYIATVNLDAGRVVIWNIGAIAVSDYPQKITLIHEVILASASIPVIFPPVMITVEAIADVVPDAEDIGTEFQAMAVESVEQIDTTKPATNTVSDP
jgi:hypothetical protein